MQRAGAHFMADQEAERDRKELGRTGLLGRIHFTHFPAPRARDQVLT